MCPVIPSSLKTEVHSSSRAALLKEVRQSQEWSILSMREPWLQVRPSTYYVMLQSLSVIQYTVAYHRAKKGEDMNRNIAVTRVLVQPIAVPIHQDVKLRSPCDLLGYKYNSACIFDLLTQTCQYLGYRICCFI